MSISDRRETGHAVANPKQFSEFFYCVPIYSSFQP
jgi:hypothetical protein